MKRWIQAILALSMVFFMTAPAAADVIWEPGDNPFYDQHRDECQYENRSYFANGSQGFVTLWDAPGGSMVRTQIENETRLWIAFIYQDWGLVSLWEDGKELSGWTPLADLALIYDARSFEEEYAGQIQPYHGEFSDYSGDAKEINFYAYPGAPEISSTRRGRNGVISELTATPDGGGYISQIFVDEDGRTWGYVAYLYGRLNAWFCLDEPDGTDFPVRTVPQQDLIPAQAPRFPAAGYLPYVLVGSVVLFTAVLLAIIFKRKKSLPSSRK